PLRAVAEGKLREDLLYRLNVFPIHLPPLRERLEDVPILARHFLEQVIEKEGESKTLSSGVLRRFQSYAWPGNVRELRNAVYRCYVMATESEITEDWLPHGDATASGGSSSAASGTATSLQIEIGTPLAEVERKVILATLKHYAGQKEQTAAALGISLKTLYNRLKDYAALLDEAEARRDH
ncbi:MAG: helix-turn-helix domain-containing protein, partial [Betaproteobacteria bacterium]